MEPFSTVRVMGLAAGHAESPTQSTHSGHISVLSFVRSRERPTVHDLTNMRREIAAYILDAQVAWAIVERLADDLFDDELDRYVAGARTAILDTGERITQLAAAALNGDEGRARLSRSFDEE